MNKKGPHIVLGTYLLVVSSYMVFISRKAGVRVQQTIKQREHMEHQHVSGLHASGFVSLFFFGASCPTTPGSKHTGRGKCHYDLAIITQNMSKPQF